MNKKVNVFKNTCFCVLGGYAVKAALQFYGVDGMTGLHANPMVNTAILVFGGVAVGAVAGAATAFASVAIDDAKESIKSGIRSLREKAFYARPECVSGLKI